MVMIPSPQMSSQTLAVVRSPSVQSAPDSTTQVELHPSPSERFPSSHWPTVGVATIPFPQASVHTLAVLESPRVQDQPVST